MLIDTHCHLNFKSITDDVELVIKRAHEAGITRMIVPGTDEVSSIQAVALAKKYDGIYAAVGIHPHHVYELNRINKESSLKIAPQVNSPILGLTVNQPPLVVQSRDVDNPITASWLKHPLSVKFNSLSLLRDIDNMLANPKVVAVGEVGLDKHQYQSTKYEKYSIDKSFIEVQRILLFKQIELALKHKKSVILHNREAKREFLEVLDSVWDNALRGRVVFHCCEPDSELLDYAIKHHIYIGIDGDITYNKKKQDFIKTVPLEYLVLETDTPFLTPEPLRSNGVRINEPGNIKIIAEFIASLIGKTSQEVAKTTTENANKLFDLPKN